MLVAAIDRCLGLLEELTGASEGVALGDLAVRLDLRRPPGREDQVADAAARVEHGADDRGRAEGRRRRR